MFNKSLLYKSFILYLFIYSTLPALTNQWNYIIDIEVNASTTEILDQIRSSTSFPLQMNDGTEISEIEITTGEYCSYKGSRRKSVVTTNKHVSAKVHSKNNT